MYLLPILDSGREGHINTSLTSMKWIPARTSVSRFSNPIPSKRRSRLSRVKVSLVSARTKSGDKSSAWHVCRSPAVNRWIQQSHRDMSRKHVNIGWLLPKSNWKMWFIFNLGLREAKTNFHPCPPLNKKKCFPSKFLFLRLLQILSFSPKWLIKCYQCT